MASKKNGAAKKDETTSAAEAPATSGLSRRNDILKPESITAALKAAGLKTKGTLVEKAERLNDYYLSQPADKITDCVPSAPPDADGNYPEGTLGCGYASLRELPECPFCGDGEIVNNDVAAEAALSADSDDPPTEDEPESEPPPVVSRSAGEPRIALVSSAAIKKARRRSKERAAESAAEQDLAASMQRSDGEEEQPPASGETSTATSAARAEDEAEMVAAAGRTSADLDAQVRRVHEARELRERTDAATFWEEGDALRVIFDEKLYCTVRREHDGGPEFRSFTEFAIKEFDYSGAHAYSLIAIARTFDRPMAERLKVLAAKSIAQAPEEEQPRLIRWALGELILPGSREPEPKPTAREVMEEVARINRALKAGPAAPPAAAEPPLRVRHDEDGVVIEDEPESRGNVSSSGAAGEKKATTPAEAKTITVSYAATRTVIPLHVNGSNVKPAKKVSDGPHGSFLSLNGMRIEVSVEVGDEGQLQVVHTIHRPD